jgi:hypothetical protein
LGKTDRSAPSLAAHLFLCEYFVLSLAFDMPSIKASIRALIGMAAKGCHRIDILG